MELVLQNLRPKYLPANGRASDIWDGERRFRQGERIFVKAPSGTGKTSLIHFMYGLRNDASGKIFWDGMALNTATEAQLATLRAQPLSIVFQDLRLFPHLTLWENLQVKKVLGSPDSDAEIENRLEMLGLQHRRNMPARLLSYGEQQRTAILRALLPPFQWLLLDEPFSHLDDANRQKAMALIEAVADARKAGIFYAELDDNPDFRATQKCIL